MTQPPAVYKMTQTLPQQSGNLGIDLGDEKLDFDARLEKYKNKTKGCAMLALVLLVQEGGCG